MLAGVKLHFVHSIFQGAGLNRKSRLALNLMALCMATLGWSGAHAADVIISAERLLDVKTGRMIDKP